MADPNGSVTRKEFNDRFDRLETKVDILMRRVAYIYGVASGVGILAGIVGSKFF